MALSLPGVLFSLPAAAGSRPPKMAAARAASNGRNIVDRSLMISKPAPPPAAFGVNEPKAKRAPAPAVKAALESSPPSPAPAVGNPIPVPIRPGSLPIYANEFPEGFYFGSASSSYQVEGAWNIDGKGESCWDWFTHNHPERIRDRSNGDISTDFYFRFEEDLKYLKAAGFNSYRFSICWPRILPKGSRDSEINQKGIEHYLKVLGLLEKYDLTPFVTLFHWETPQAMEDEYESMLSKDFVDDYLNYVDICFKYFGDKVKYWITFNEPSYVCNYGYSTGNMPPLRCSSWMQNGCLAGDSSREPYQALHNIVLAHASAVHLYRDKYKKSQGGQIGVTLTTTWFLPYDATSKQDIDACERALQFNLGWFLDPITQGDYPSIMRHSLGDRLPKFYGQAEWIKGTYDFIGINYYRTAYGQHNPTNTIPGKETYESDMHFTLHDIIGYPAGNHPEGIKALLLYIKNNYKNPTIYITENGIKTTNHPEPLPVEEHMNDQIRISYFSNHFTKLKEAIDEFEMKEKGKLTRTHSSLARSPTVRSSFHSLSSFAAGDDAAGEDEEEEKPHRPPSHGRRPHQHRRRLLLLHHHHLLSLVFLLLLVLVLFAYLREGSPLFANVLIFSALALLASLALRRSAALFSRFSSSSSSSAARRSSSVDWFIGDDDEEEGRERKEKTNGRSVREGVEFYSNGDFYEGEFHKGRCNGSGVFNFFASKGRYEGDWVDGKYDGHGIESWARGSRYRGQYRQGHRHGFGVYKFYSSDSYAGEWVNGQSHGVGVQACSDGSSYVGEFKCGVKHGLGYYHFRNGDQYLGEYFGDKMHGFGVYRFANGHCYEGSWHEGKKQGFGLYSFRNGDMRSGEWDCGSLKAPLPPSDSSVQRAVQAARKVAENSLLVPRVDEQVNKAVTAANRAATAARVAAIKAVQNRMDGKFCDTDV